MEFSLCVCEAGAALAMAASSVASGHSSDSLPGLGARRPSSRCQQAVPRTPRGSFLPLPASVLPATLLFLFPAVAASLRSLPRPHKASCCASVCPSPFIGHPSPAPPPPTRAPTSYISTAALFPISHSLRSKEGPGLWGRGDSTQHSALLGSVPAVGFVSRNG